MKCISVLGRQPEISLAELSALFKNVQKISPHLATFDTGVKPNINHLGGSLKLGQKLDGTLIDYLLNLPEGKITIGISDYSKKATTHSVSQEAMRLKKILTRKGRSVRIVQNKAAILSTATSHHNHLGNREKAIEIIKYGKDTYISLGTQNITAYARRDQARPARDAKVGMLPPKLAQILINLCGPLPTGARILDPFCGTGVLLQEAFLMGYAPYGTDIDPRMVEYSQKNLRWLIERGDRNGNRQTFASETMPRISYEKSDASDTRDGGLAQAGLSGEMSVISGSKKGAGDHYTTIQDLVLCGDATNFKWSGPISAVACETYLGQPMSTPPAEIKLKQEKHKCRAIIHGFLKNLQSQISKDTPVVIAIPAWLRPDGRYSKLDLDFLDNLEYNRYKESGFGDLLYYRDGQIVARNIITLRKK